MPFSWYVLHSKPNREQFLYSQLRHREIEVYYPRLKVKPVNPRARKVKPFFPGYLFVHVDLDQTPLSSLTYIPGASNVVCFDYQPATVPEDVITTIKKNISRLNRQVDQKKPGLMHGDPVIILSGPFEGYQAIFDTELEGCERVRLLVRLLHDQHVRVQVPKEMAQPKYP